MVATVHYRELCQEIVYILLGNEASIIKIDTQLRIGNFVNDDCTVGKMHIFAYFFNCFTAAFVETIKA